MIPIFIVVCLYYYLKVWPSRLTSLKIANKEAVSLRRYGFICCIGLGGGIKPPLVMIRNL